MQSTGSRTAPDVSFVADPATGAWVADAYNLDPSNPWEVVGGTSLSAPAWAGLLALADQGRAAAGEGTLGTAGPQEAQTALVRTVRRPITTRSRRAATGTCAAGSGYNLVTGLGTPVANLLIPDLVAYTGGPGSSTPVAPITASGLVLSAESGSGAGSTEAALTVFSARTMAELAGGAVPSSWGVASPPANSSDPTIPVADGTGFGSGVTAPAPANPQRPVVEPVELSPGSGNDALGAYGYAAVATGVSADHRLDGGAGASAPRSEMATAGDSGPRISNEAVAVSAEEFADAFPDFAPIVVALPNELI